MSAIVRYLESVAWDRRVDLIGPKTEKEAEFEKDFPTYTAGWKETNLAKKEKAQHHFKILTIVMVSLFATSFFNSPIRANFRKVIYVCSDSK